VTLATLHTGIQCVLLLAQQPAEVAAAGAVLVEAGHNPTQHFVYIVTLGDNGQLRSMSAHKALERALVAGQHVAIHDAQVLALGQAAFQHACNLSTHLHTGVCRSLHLRTDHGDDAGQIHLALVEQTTDEDNLLGTQCPHHFTLVHGSRVVDLYTHVSCGMRSVEHRHGHTLGLLQGSTCLLGAHAQISGSHLGQRVKTRLEVSLLTIQHILELGSQRLRVECRHEDGTGSHLGRGNHVVRTLLEESEQTCLQQSLLHLCATERRHTLLAKFHHFVTLSSNAHAEHLAACTALNQRHLTADRRNEFYFRVILVDEQGFTRFDHLLLLDNHLGSHTREVIRTECIPCRRLHIQHLPRWFALQIDVQTFT